MPGQSPRNRSVARRRRAVPLVLLALSAFVGGAVTAARQAPDEQRVAERFVTAWERGDHAAMHAELTPSAKKAVPLDRFRRLYRQASETATLQKIARAGLLRVQDGVATVPMVARTQVFGPVDAALQFALAEEEGEVGVMWDRRLVFPGLRRGEKLQRTVVTPPRADLEARDGTVIASGPDRAPEGAPAAGGVTGTVGPVPEESRMRFARLGYPQDAVVGLSGLEREFETRLAGRFGGFLRASGRVLARVKAEQAKPVRTSIDLDVQEAAVTAIGARLGGVVVTRPASGEVLALAGIAYSAPQPPGSVFKIITLAGALEEKVVKSSARFPVETFTTIEGVELENANGESCGGTLTYSFAHSCNSVFAPLGVRLGAEKLVATAERFGFNRLPSLKGAAMSTLPDPEEIGDDLAVGSSAIGQGVVQATPLQMAEVTGAIANRGKLVRSTLKRGGQGERTPVVSARTARLVDRMMRRVITDGTGGAARIEGVAVAGKTGTAELRDTTPEPSETPDPAATPAPVNDPTDTTAWFVAYAPARKPRVAVAVMLVGEGAGGESAAPVARAVLLEALRKR